MKNLGTYFIIICIISGCTFRFDRHIGITTYSSIQESKKNGVFITEFKPQQPFFIIEGKEYNIKEAWLEHAHVELDFSDKQTLDTCFVASIDNVRKENTDLHYYVKEMGNGPGKIWFAITNDNYKNDTIFVYYRDQIESPKKNKKFLFTKANKK